MLYANVSSEDHKRMTNAMKQTKDIRWYQRLHIIQLSAKGRSVPELAELFDKCPATIREYINRYNRGGLASLKRQFSAGPPTQIPMNKADWEELLHQSPSQFDQLRTAARNWNQMLIVTYLQCYHNITVTRQAVAANLKRHGIRLNRGRLKVTSPDPLYTVKRAGIDALKKNAKAGTLSSHDVPGADPEKPAKPAKLVFLDSTDLHWCPDVGLSYVPQGSQTKTDSPGKANPWYALFGSLVYPDGTGVYTIHERKRHQEVQAHLEVLLESEPDTFWLVVMDNASAHTTPKLDAFWEAHRDQLCPIPLPTYSPHLNLIERLWRVMRGQMTRDQFYHSLKELAEAVVEWLETLPLSQFCSLMGIKEIELVLT